MKNKKQLGQFFTKNSDYILKGLEKFIKGKEVVDPFAGRSDLIDWAVRNGARKATGCDIDLHYIDNKKVFQNDSINNPKKYKFVLTNPPYLNINKADKKTKEKYFDERGLEDLYQISLFSIMDSEEGIVIVPINFLSAENSKKIRRMFFYNFIIPEMNYFKHQVFPDTTYNVIAFYYKKRRERELNEDFAIKTHIYPDNKDFEIKLKHQFDWTIGGDFLNEIKKTKNGLGIYRLTDKNINSGDTEIKMAYNHIENILSAKVSPDLYKLIKSNIIFLKAIDSGTEKGKIALENIKKRNIDCLVSKESSRHMIHLIFRKKISIPEQEKIILLFNKEINRLRDNYLSLFLTNYRDNDRKRISFDFVYKFINYLYIKNLFNKKQTELFC